MEKKASRRNWTDEQKKAHSKKLNEMLRKIIEIENRKEREAFTKALEGIKENE